MESLLLLLPHLIELVYPKHHQHHLHHYGWHSNHDRHYHWAHYIPLQDLSAKEEAWQESQEHERYEAKSKSEYKSGLSPLYPLHHVSVVPKSSDVFCQLSIFLSVKFLLNSLYICFIFRFSLNSLLSCLSISIVHLLLRDLRSIIKLYHIFRRVYQMDHPSLRVFHLNLIFLRRL